MMLRPASAESMIAADARWTDVEARAWELMQTGREVRLPGPCPDDTSTEEDASRNANRPSFTLGGAFLRQTLTEPPYRGVTSKLPVVIYGAHVVGSVYADGGISQSRLVIGCTTFDDAVLFNDWTFAQRFAFHNVKVSGSIRIREVDAKSGFTVSRSDLHGIEVTESNIDGTLSLRETLVHDKVSVVNTEVGNSVLMGCREERSDGEHCATYGATDFINVSVGRSIHLVGSHFKSSAKFESLRLGGNLITNGVQYSGDLLFIGGTIDGRVYASEARSAHGLYALGTVVRGGMDVRKGIYGSVKILDTDIHRDLDLGETDVAFFLDISGTGVHGALRLAPLSRLKQEEADSRNRGFRRHFIARNARVRVLEDTRDAWERWSVLDLSGFEYEKLSSLGKSVRERADNPYVRGAGWFKKNWLDRMETYSPQPYNQLSALLRREGQVDTANAVLFEGKDRERAGLSWTDGRRWWLELLRHTIGYGVGLRAFRALVWMALFAAIGWLITTRGATGENGKSAGLAGRFWYSMTFTIPGIALARVGEIKVTPRARYWLYVQQLVCFALALLAGAAAVGIVDP